MTKLLNPRLGNGFYSMKKDEWLNPFDRLLDEMMSAQNPELHRVFGDSIYEKNAYPKVNIIDEVGSIVIEASVPGMKKDDISIEVEGQTLTIASMYNSDMKEEKRDGIFLRREIKKSKFTRSFNLSKELNLSEISADIDSGLLTIKIPKLLPKVEQALKKRVQIN